MDTADPEQALAPATMADPPDPLIPLGLILTQITQVAGNQQQTLDRLIASIDHSRQQPSSSQSPSASSSSTPSADKDPHFPVWDGNPTNLLGWLVTVQDINDALQVGPWCPCKRAFSSVRNPRKLESTR